MRLFLKVSPFFALVPLVRSDLCFILYQMADNDLEYFIRQDLEEYSQSPMIAKDETTTWVYFDHRNFRTNEDININETLSFVYNSDGSGRGGPKPEGSFYYTYNHNLSKLVVDSELGELNSDIPQTVYDFATKALGDCKSKGSDEFMFAFSSHGGGFIGFGGDENQRRQLALQSNQNIVQGLRKALDDHSIQKFDMVGFDACLMMAFGALDEFKAVANFFIASEEVEPGHGWSYSNLQGGTAMDTAKEILNSFIDDKQGDKHRTPKTLAIVDTSKYESFSTKWNDFSKELVALMKDNDAEVATALSRARKSAYDFGGDDAKDKASIDMMSFLVEFGNLCKPKDNTQLATLLESVKTEYDKMFVERRTGPGTPTSLTGMHIFWPSRKRYSSGDSDIWDKVLMNDAVTATTSAPEWINLLKAYYTAKTPSASGNTVCSISTGGSDSDENGDSIGLMMDSLIYGSPNDGMEFATNISRSVDDVFVEYGADLTPLLEMTRRLSRSHKGQETMDHPRYPNRRRQMQSRRRRLQDEIKGGDYLYISGGDLVGAFEGNKYSTSWDGKFFGVNDSLSGLFSEIYVFDYGEGAKEFPVIYFPPKKRIATEDLFNIVSYKDALDAGAKLGYVTFNTNMDISTGLALYTIADSSSESFSELPRSRGGQIVPVNFALASIGGIEFDTIFGGLKRTGIIDWNINNNIEIQSIPAVDYLNYFDVKVLTFDVVASDDATGDTSVILLELSATGKLLDSLSINYNSGEPTIAPSISPVESPTVIIDSNCKTENRKLATCYANRPECQTCSKKHPVIKLSSLEKGNPLEKICSEMKEEFKYCGCDACEAEKEAVLECQCDDTNSGSQNILTFWTGFAITLIASIML